jgi:S1-C subfamily serine protease
MKLADQIESGTESSTIHIGLPAFLGVSISSVANVKGALVESLLDGPAAAAGVQEGSVITKVGGTPITTGSALRTALQKYQPGDHVKISWTDATGASHSATVTLATGPAD